MNLTAIHVTLLAAGLGAPALIAAVVIAPLVAGYLLLVRAAKGRPAMPGLAGESGSLAGAAALRHEMAANYERLRRAGEAVPLATEAWQRVSVRSDILPASVAEQVRRAYEAIAVSNRLLAAASAYDSRGHLSMRQRRLSLWPTLETAVWSALEAMVCNVERIAHARSSVTSAEAASAEVAASRGASNLFDIARAPRLALFYGGGGAPVTGRLIDSASVSRPRAHRRRRVSAPVVRADDGQMALWESVA